MDSVARDGTRKGTSMGKLKAINLGESPLCLLWHRKVIPLGMLFTSGLGIRTN